VSGILQGLLASINAPAGPWLYGWGRNNIGQVGDGTTVARSSPVQIGDSNTWSKLSGGTFNSAAIKTDGTLWSWGQNTYGQLGDGTVVNKSSPIQVGALTTWSVISCHLASPGSCNAIKTDGTLWSWGSNSYGQFGDNTTVNKSSPIQIGALTTWSKISSGTVVLAIKTDGTLWGWGRNSQGQVADNTAVSRSSPIQIGALTTWSNVSTGGLHGLAIKTDGTLWAWGYNGFGQLGLNDTNNRSSPVQVGALTTWSAVSGGNYFTLALKTDGTIWSWGIGSNGQLGAGGGGAGYHRSSPVQIGALTTWSKIEAGGRTSASIKTDGTLWTWGYNLFGEAGDNSGVNRSSPVQIGSETWSVVTGSRSGMLAIED